MKEQLLSKLDELMADYGAQDDAAIQRFTMAMERQLELLRADGEFDQTTYDGLEKVNVSNWYEHMKLSGALEALREVYCLAQDLEV